MNRAELRLIIFLLLFLLLLLMKVNCQNWVLERLLPNDYDKHQFPLNGNDGTTVIVNASIIINNFVVTEKTQVTTK